MKHNFKRLLVLVCMFACLFAMTACGEDNDKNIKLSEDLMEQLINENEEALLAVRTLTQEQLQATVDAGTLPVEYGNALKSYYTISDDLGSFKSVDSTKVTTTADSIIVVSETTYSERTMTFTMTYDAKCNFTFGKFEPYYSFGEKMAKAGMNTLIGMGTVFIVLIGMSFIISLFKYIGTAGTKKADNKKTDGAEAVDNTIAQIVEKEEAAMDDLELVAVITAAIAASEGTSSDGLVVRSIRKVNKSKWLNA